MISRDGIKVLPDTLKSILVEDLAREGQALRRWNPKNVARVHVTESGWRINVTPARVTREHLGPRWGFIGRVTRTGRGA